MALSPFNHHLRKKLSKSLFKKESRYGYLSILGILLTFSFFFLTLRYPFIQEKLDALFLKVTAPMVKGFYKISSDFSTFSHLLRSQKSLEKEKRKLKDTITKLSLENVTLKSHLSSYKEMENLLSIKPLSMTPVTTTSILNLITTSSGQYLVLDGGEKIGIKKNAYAINKYGLVGRVEVASSHYAKVQLFTDASSRIPIITKNTKHHAILAGRNNRAPILNLILDSSSNGTSIKNGDAVLTSGEGGIFAPNIFIGTIFACDSNWCVKPPSAFNNSSYIMVFNPLVLSDKGSIF